MKKRFLALALVAIPLLGSCNMKKVEYAKWKEVYDAAMTANKEQPYTKIRIKGKTDGDKFDSGFENYFHPTFFGAVQTVYGLAGSADYFINSIKHNSGASYDLLVSGKNYGFKDTKVEVHYNGYGLVTYYCDSTYNATFTYKK